MAKKKAKTRRATRRRPKRKSGRPKTVSLSKIVIVGGVLAITTAIGATQADRLMVGIQGFSSEAGLGAVTGARIVFIVVGLSAAATLMPRLFGTKYRAFLGKFGLRP